MYSTKSYLSYKIICIIIIVLSAFTLCHADLIGWNVTWGRQFLECVKNGNLREFQLILEAKNMPTNYNIFLNFFFAIALLPVYLLEQITSAPISNCLYAAWFKLIIIAFTIITIHFFSKCLQLLNIDDTKAFLLKILYVASPFCLLASIGMGQVDFLGNFFFVLGIYMFLKKKYRLMSLFISFAATVKGFAFIFYIPLILLLFAKNIRELIKNIVISLSFPVLITVLTRLIFIDYSRVSSSLEERYNFAERLFTVSANKISAIIFIATLVCAYSFYLSNHDKVKKYHYILLGMIIFTSFVLTVLWHPQWLIYSLPIILIMAAYFDKFDDFLILNFFMNISYIIYVNSNKGFAMDLNLIKNSLFAYIIPSANPNIYHPIENYLDLSKLQAFNGIFAALYLFIVIVFILEMRSEKQSNFVFDHKKKILVYAQFLPMLIFIADLLFVYLH